MKLVLKRLYHGNLTGLSFGHMHSNIFEHLKEDIIRKYNKPQPLMSKCLRSAETNKLDGFFFQVEIYFHPGHLQLKTLVYSFNALKS